MKQRILVMNGQRLVQSEYDHQWVTTKVGKAGQIPPGIYNISSATVASKDKAYQGVVLHADQEHLYQQVGKTCVRHSAHDFSKLPGIGTQAAIHYDAGRVATQEAQPALNKGMKR
jgi:cell filamentation protein